MNLLELSEKRYSVRGYSSESVSDEDLNYILECARLAPSAVNRQPWHFYICKFEDALAKVRKCYPREWFYTAPMVIVACINHEEEWVRQNDGHPHGIVDISIAVEHICLAATERGLGSCWVCNFDAKLCHELFDMPADREPAVLIPIGRGTTEFSEKKRKNISDIVTEII